MIAARGKQSALFIKVESNLMCPSHAALSALLSCTVAVATTEAESTASASDLVRSC